MSDRKSIFVTTDFSPCAEYAMRYAVELARRLGATITLGHVVDTSYLTYAALYGQQVVIDSNVSNVEHAAKNHLAEAVERIRELGVDAKGEFARGTPVTELIHMIGASDAVLTVMGTHGHTGFNRLLFGSTCEKLLRQSPTPVLAVKQPGADATFDPDKFALDRILCTTDLSDLSRTVLPLAAEFCASLDARLTVLHVIDSRFDTLPYAAMDEPTLRQLDTRAEHVLKEWTQSLKAPRIDTRVLHGLPNMAIADFIRDQNIDLLIMATHGHGGLAHALLGSTTERVVRTATCPVLAVRPK
jgi:nucleotide-binding universal stress UspA family protein